MEEFIEFGSEDHRNLINAVEYLAEARTLLRRYLPGPKIPVRDSYGVLRLMKDAAAALIPIFFKLGIIAEEPPVKDPSQRSKMADLKEKIGSDTAVTGPNKVIEITSTSRLLSVLENKAVIVSSNNARKKLKTLGVPPNMIKSIGGLLNPDDYSLLNIKLNENARKGLERRITKLGSELEKMGEKGIRMVFIYAEDDRTDLLNLRRIESFADLYKIKLEIVKISSWDTL